MFAISFEPGSPQRPVLSPFAWLRHARRCSALAPFPGHPCERGNGLPTRTGKAYPDAHADGMARTPDDPQQDLELVRRALDGDAVAKPALADRLRCVPRMLAGLNARHGRPLDEHDLADAVQDTLLVVWRKLSTYDGRTGLEGFVFKICVFELMNAIRRQRRQPQAFDPNEHPPVDPADDVLRRWIEREAIDRAIDRVGNVEATALRLKHWEGLTFDEMAARLGTSPANAKDRYYRGLARLCEILRKERGNEEQGHE
mgnify:CR=1 FL=1